MKTLKMREELERLKEQRELVQSRKEKKHMAAKCDSQNKQKEKNR